MDIGHYLQAAYNLTVLEAGIASHLLNGLLIPDILNLTSLTAQEVRTLISSIYSKLEDESLKKDLERIHLIFKLTKKKRRFLI